LSTLGLVVYILQRYIKEKAGWICTITAASSVALILSMAKPVLDRYNNGDKPIVYIYPWIKPININFGFLVDVLSLPVSLIIAVVSTLSCLYSIKYMEKEQNQPSYYANLLIFMTS